MSTTTLPIHPWVAEGTDRFRFGVETLAMPDWGATRSWVQAIEGAGFDSLWIPDHPMATGSATWTHLAAFATVTERIRLGPLVACVAYTNPFVIARAIADIDLLSGGRAVLGLGSGDMPHEFAQMGLPWRGGRLSGNRRLKQPSRCSIGCSMASPLSLGTARLRPTAPYFIPRRYTHGSRS